MRIGLVGLLGSLLLAGGSCKEDPEPKPEPEVVDPFHDPLSMPETPTHSIDAFTPAATCGGCHPQHHAEWSRSMHAYAMTDPVYRTLVGIRQADFDGTQDPFCTQCHTAIGTRGGDIVDQFVFEDLAPITLEGVTCEACHKIASLERTHNAGHVLDPDGPIRGPIRDPAESGFHESEWSPLFEDSALCGSCHDVIEVSGLQLERPYEEWLESPSSEQGTTCQGCHMPTYQGRAGPGAKMRTLHRHDWVGVDVPLADGFVSDRVREEVRDGVLDLLDGSGTVLLDATPVPAGDPLHVVVTVRNEIEGHNLPTGSTFIRQVWLELVARDASGTVLYETGTLDGDGNLRDHWSAEDPYGDADLIAFHSGFVDENGAPTPFPWRAAEHFTRSIPPLYDRTFTLFVPTSPTTPGPIQIEARLRFRTHAPWLLTAIGMPDYVERIQIYDIDANALSVGLTP